MSKHADPTNSTMTTRRAVREAEEQAGVAKPERQAPTRRVRQESSASVVITRVSDGGDSVGVLR